MNGRKTCGGWKGRETEAEFWAEAVFSNCKYKNQLYLVSLLTRVQLCLSLVKLACCDSVKYKVLSPGKVNAKTTSHNPERTCELLQDRELCCIIPLTDCGVGGWVRIVCLGVVRRFLLATAFLFHLFLCFVHYFVMVFVIINALQVSLDLI